MSKAPIKTPAKATVVSQKRQLQGEDKRVYEELRQDYNAARSDNIKKIIKACMDFIYEKRAPANGGEVLWALDEQANICSWKKHCELWADDLVKRKNSNEMIAMAGPELQMMAGAQDPARPVSRGREGGSSVAGTNMVQSMSGAGSHARSQAGGQHAPSGGSRASSLARPGSTRSGIPPPAGQKQTAWPLFP